MPPTPATRAPASALRALQQDTATALRQAAATGDLDTLRNLLDTVDIDARDDAGRTALLLAVAAGRASAVEILLAHGADPNAVDADGHTPLELAHAAGQDLVVAMLQRAGARAPVTRPNP
jgi:ankyrin repeat protein